MKEHIVKTETGEDLVKHYVKLKRSMLKIYNFIYKKYNDERYIISLEGKIK